MPEFSTERFPSLPDLLRKRASSFASEMALLAPERSWTYSELVTDVLRVAGALKKAGVKKGDRVAFLSHNRAEVVLAFYATWLLEATVVPLSFRLPPENIARYLELVEPSLVVVEEQLSDALSFPTTVELEKLVAVPAKLDDVPSWEQPNPLVTMVFTSGSMGQPRIVCHRWSNHYFSAKGANANIPFKLRDRWLANLPLYHVGGLAVLFRALLGGGCVVFLQEKDWTMDILREKGITHLSLVTTQLKRLLDRENERQQWEPLKCVLLGGGPIPESLVHKAHRLRLPLFTTYGSTEMSSQITTTAPGDSLQHLLTAGRVLPYREVTIAPDGEILVKGKTLFQGYWENRSFHLPLDEHGWFHTGDVGRMTIDGYLKVIGRKDNMFISGGENIHPEAIESVLLKMPGVRQAVVVPVPHQEYGHRPVAFVDVEDTTQFQESRFRDSLRPFLPGFKIPDAIWLWPKEAPAGFKPNRAFFRELALQKWQSDK